MRAAAAVLLGLVAAAPVDAARLCRDIRGLYTPCLEAVGHDRMRAQSMPRTAAPARTSVASAAPAARATPAKPARPPLFATGHLCRDSKGLATPCPR